MTFGKTALRCWLPAAALLLALLCPLPVAAARAGTAIPVSVRTDGAAADAVYAAVAPDQDQPGGRIARRRISCRGMWRCCAKAARAQA